jgi:hypothetical protein
MSKPVDTQSMSGQLTDLETASVVNLRENRTLPSPKMHLCAPREKTCGNLVIPVKFAQT